MINLASWRIALALLCCLAIFFTVRAFGQSVQYRWWVHQNNKRRANDKLIRWSSIRAGATPPETTYERKISIMTEYTYMKAVRNMLWEHDLYELGKAMWGQYTKERPYVTVNVEWQENKQEDEVIYDHRPVEDENTPLPEQNQGRLSVNQ